MKKLFEYFARLLRTPSADEIAAQDLEKSRLMALKHKEQSEYHKYMTTFYDQQVIRLRAYTGQEGATSRGN
jgi:hypothetical protein